jgi:prepilin-type N-terminal cleavage/methylation domain-containing protein
VRNVHGIDGQTPVRTAPGRRSGARSRAGLTLLEVVLAVVILGLVAAAITGAISTVETLGERSRQTVAAHELAHRLVLTWLDDQKRMPTETLPLDYGPYRFMWDKEEVNVRMDINDAQRSATSSAPQALNRFKLVTVNVYMAEGSGPQPYPGPQLASLSRIYDPAAPRNPESMKTITDPDNLSRLLRELTGQNIPTPPTGGRK